MSKRLKWRKEDPREGSRTETWVAYTPFGDIRVCTSGLKAMCISHPIPRCSIIGVELNSVDEACAAAEKPYIEMLTMAVIEVLP